METIVDKFGRIVIPKKIRNEHNIEPGTQVRIEEKDDVIILIPVRGEHSLQSKDGVLSIHRRGDGGYWRGSFKTSRKKSPVSRKAEMKVLFDTSVIVAGLVEAHPMHGRAFRWVKQAIVGKFELVVASHTIAESYAVLSSLPVKPRISPLVARKLLRENIVSICKIISLTPIKYLNTINWLAERSLVVGITYDALIAKVAQKSRVEKLVTMNVDDFMRVWPEGEDVIVAP